MAPACDTVVKKTNLIWPHLLLIILKAYVYICIIAIIRIMNSHFLSFYQAKTALGHFLKLPYSKVNYPGIHCTLEKKKLKGSCRRIPSHGVAALHSDFCWTFLAEGQMLTLTQPGQHLFYFSTSTLLRNPLNRHSLGSLNFFLPECD